MVSNQIVVSDGVRVEATFVAGRPVVHNYGHGGSGFTCSWGAARDTAQLVSNNLPPSARL